MQNGEIILFNLLKTLSNHSLFLIRKESNDFFSGYYKLNNPINEFVSKNVAWISVLAGGWKLNL